MPIIFEIIFSMVIILFGLYFVLRPQLMMLKIKYFYKKYSLFHYVDESQLALRQIFMALFGVILIFVGTYGLVSNI